MNVQVGASDLSAQQFILADVRSLRPVELQIKVSTYADWQSKLAR